MRRILIFFVAFTSVGAWCAEAPEAAASAPETWSVHSQLTYTVQGHSGFNSPYAGAQSLGPDRSAKETFDATLFLGRRLWSGGEVYFNPEVDQGFGLSSTLGVAGFPSGEAYKVGHSSPYGRLDRLFVRQVFDLGGESVRVEPDQNALSGSHAADNVTLTVGKFSVVDLFDANTYAHDAHSDFLNWSIIDAGGFDYAADAWGYSYGAALEWTQQWWTIRAGGFALSKVPNGETLDRDFGEYELVSELELRGSPWGRPGKAKLLAFMNHGRMGRYGEALASAAANGGTPDVSAVRRSGSRAGVALNFELEVADNLGAFARWSTNDGSKETYEFTDVNRSLSGGLSLKGCAWRRCGDTVGVAAVSNALSSDARAYFAAGGLGLLIGDGQLPHYGAERIAEAFYSIKIVEGISLTADAQRIVYPAYNRDRGPVTIWALRGHAEF